MATFWLSLYIASVVILMGVYLYVHKYVKEDYNVSGSLMALIIWPFFLPIFVYCVIEEKMENKKLRELAELEKSEKLRRFRFVRELDL